MERILLAGTVVALVVTAASYAGHRHYLDRVRAIEIECKQLGAPEQLRRAEAKLLGFKQDELEALLERANHAVEGPCAQLFMPLNGRPKELDAQRRHAVKMERLISSLGYPIAACILLLSGLPWVWQFLRGREKDTRIASHMAR